MTKIDDVARLARVSTATVSRALRGLPTVSESTRARVLAAAEQLGYTASPSASRLAGGRTGSIAVVVPRITRWFFGTVVEAAEETLRQAGYDLLLYNLGDREQNRRQLFQTTNLQKRVDALMLVATPLRRRRPRRHRPTAAARRHGQLRRTPYPGWPSVRIDDVSAARTGHRTPARAGPPPDRPPGRRRLRRTRLHHPPRPAARLPAGAARRRR